MDKEKTKEKGKAQKLFILMIPILLAVIATVLLAMTMGGGLSTPTPDPITVESEETTRSDILAGVEPEAKPDAMFTTVAAVELQMKEMLEKLGYKVDTGLGNENNRISLAIYDPETDKYLVGVELDTDAFKESKSCLERDVYKPRFLESRGWTIVRVWCRDWWLYPAKVVKTITTIAEKNKKAK